MTRWSIDALRCDRCGAEVEERNEAKPVAKEWGAVTALAAADEGKVRRIGDGVNPADLCTACIDSLFHWYADCTATPAPPRPQSHPPVIKHVRDTISLDDMTVMGTIIAKAMAAQASAAVEILREQPSAILMELSDPDFPPVLRNLAMFSLRAAREIIVRFRLMNGEDLARIAPKQTAGPTPKEQALAPLIDAAINGDEQAGELALAAYENLPE